MYHGNEISIYFKREAAAPELAIRLLTLIEKRLIDCFNRCYPPEITLMRSGSMANSSHSRIAVSTPP